MTSRLRASQLDFVTRQRVYIEENFSLILSLNGRRNCYTRQKKSWGTCAGRNFRISPAPARGAFEPPSKLANKRVTVTNQILLLLFLEMNNNVYNFYKLYIINDIYVQIYNI